ncbi:phasin family protein [Bradyrhizobium sp. SBR1B]|uniref:phasin family protein n=1 Tax=Bradyrhizobium sp. SBR1B TaxID=2663836 RepID=UPI001605D447|nr:phasin family protein [Bradyrhizobium sp. SBR1B]MBB4380270.1 phasin family protein [Bradyrhizobium sp. SBR1B]
MPDIIEDAKRERRSRGGPEQAEAPLPGVGDTTDQVTGKTSAGSRILFAIPDWQKSIEATGSLLAAGLREALKLTASSLHDQAAFVKTLADSKNPSDLLKCQLEFVEQSWSKLFGEGSKILDRLKQSQRSSAS